MNTILVTVDAVRADHLGQYGYERETMPVLDRLIDDGTIFTNAYANGPYTRISVPSFHTSTYLGYQDIQSLPTIASVLSENHVHTACIGTRTGFSSVEGDLHFDEYVDLGRDEYHEKSEESHAISRKIVENAGDILQLSPTIYQISNKIYESVGKLGISHFSYKGYQSAKQVTDSAIEWLNENADSDFFLWIHYMEGHRPYGVHNEEPAYTEPISNENIRDLMKIAGTEPDKLTIENHTKLVDLYDSDLRYCSQQFDRFIDELHDRDLWDETNIFFTSDHGEEFYDHGMYFHRNLPYDELLHVPLVVRSTEMDSGEIDKQRQLLDLAPTVLDFHTIDKPDSFQGENLFEDVDRNIIAVGSQLQEGQTVAIQQGSYKYIWTEDEEELYEISTDSLEEHNTVNTHSKIRKKMFESIPTPILNAQNEELREPSSEVDKKQLESLGYLET
jgi:arylsulfatase A-like enzyme